MRHIPKLIVGTVLAVCLSPAFGDEVYRVGELVEFPSSEPTSKWPTRIGEIAKDAGDDRYNIEYAVDGRRRSATVMGEKLTRLNNVQSPRERTWTDQTGRFHFKAVFLKHANKEVHLKQANGEIEKVEVGLLCPTDRTYLESIKTPPRTGGASPFDGGKVAGPEPAPMAYANARSIKLLKADWTYKASKPAFKDPESATKDAAVFSFPVEFAEEITGFVVSNDRSRGAVSVESRRDDRTNFFLWNVQSGEQLAYIELEEESLYVADVHNSGKYFLVGGDWTSGSASTEVRLVNLDGEEVFKWNVGGRSDGVKVMRLIGTKGLLVVDAKNSLSLWNWVTKRIVYKIVLDDRREPAFAVSDDGRTFAMLVHEGENAGVQILSIGGRVLGTLPISKETKPTRLAFNFSGTKLAGITGSRSSRTLLIWDLEQQGKLTSIPLPKGIGSTDRESFVWCDERFLFCFGDLIDTEIKSVVWRYTLPRSGLDKVGVQRLSPGKFLATAGRRDSTRVLPLTIPHKSALSDIADLDPKKLFSISPSTKVKVEADLSLFSKEHKEQVDAVIKRWMDGLEEAEQAEIVLRVNVEKLEGQEVETSITPRRTPGQRRPKPIIETVTTSPHKHSVTLTHAKHGVLYEFEQLRKPNQSVRIRNEDTPQQAADRAFGPNGYAINSEILRIPKAYILSEGGAPPFVAGNSVFNEEGTWDDR